MQQYHHYDQAGVYLGSTPVDVDARDPDVVMPPPYGATLTAPPVGATGTVAVFDGTAWALAPDRRGFAYWLADGSRHTIDRVGVEPPDDALAAPPPVKTTVVTPRQIRQVLTAAGLRAGVEAAVAAGNQDLKDWWEFSSSFERAHPVLTSMASALGLTTAQVDALFERAALL